MNASTENTAAGSLMQRLKQETAAEHERMESLMQRSEAFASKENYAQFTLSQYYFQKDVEHLYQDPAVEQLIPDLDVRGRSEAALQDLADLGLEPQQQGIFTAAVSYPQSLGWIYVSEGSDFVDVNGNRRHIYSYLQDFLFSPERARTPVKALSGGERNRILLAKLLLKPSNLIVMDEPTNDLDMVTLELLEEMLSDYKGTLLLISHDRAFMDNVVTSTWVFDGKGNIDEYIGGYQDYLEQRPDQKVVDQKSDVKKAQAKAEAAAAAASAPKKVKLSYKDQRELEQLPAEMEKLEKEQAELSAKLADGSWFVSDANAATLASQRLAEIEESLLEKLERWDILENMSKGN